MFDYIGSEAATMQSYCYHKFKKRASFRKAKSLLVGKLKIIMTKVIDIGAHVSIDAYIAARLPIKAH